MQIITKLNGNKFSSLRGQETEMQTPAASQFSSNSGQIGQQAGNPHMWRRAQQSTLAFSPGAWQATTEKSPTD